MQLSEVQSLLSKVQSITGDVELVLKDVESGAETVIQNVGLELGANGDPNAGTVTITHGSKPAPAPADPESAAAEPQAAGGAST